MIDLLKAGNVEVREFGGPLPPERQESYRAQWAALLTLGESYFPASNKDDPSADRPGRKRQSKEYNLLLRLRVYADDVWRFMSEPGVPFTNNLAEQALRMCKVRQKVAGCFRTEHGAQTFFTIRSYLATMQKQGHGLYECLVSAFDGNPIQPRFA
jgi:transposase